MCRERITKFRVLLGRPAGAGSGTVQAPTTALAAPEASSPHPCSSPRLAESCTVYRARGNWGGQGGREDPVQIAVSGSCRALKGESREAVQT